MQLIGDIFTEYDSSAKDKLRLIKHTGCTTIMKIRGKLIALPYFFLTADKMK